MQQHYSQRQQDKSAYRAALKIYRILQLQSEVPDLLGTRDFRSKEEEMRWIHNCAPVPDSEILYNSFLKALLRFLFRRTIQAIPRG